LILAASAKHNRYCENKSLKALISRPVTWKVNTCISCVIVWLRCNWSDWVSRVCSTRQTIGHFGNRSFQAIDCAGIARRPNNKQIIYNKNTKQLTYDKQPDLENTQKHTHKKKLSLNKHTHSSRVRTAHMSVQGTIILIHNTAQNTRTVLIISLFLQTIIVTLILSTGYRVHRNWKCCM